MYQNYELAQLIKSLDEKGLCQFSIGMGLLLNGVAPGMTPQKLTELANQEIEKRLGPNPTEDEYRDLTSIILSELSAKYIDE